MSSPATATLGVAGPVFTSSAASNPQASTQPGAGAASASAPRLSAHAGAGARAVVAPYVNGNVLPAAAVATIDGSVPVPDSVALPKAAPAVIAAPEGMYVPRRCMPCA